MKRKLLIALTIASLAGAALAADNEKPLVTNADDLVYTPLHPEDTSGKSVLIHIVFGAMNQKAPIAFLAKLPAGFSAGWHSHSSDSYLTTIKGNYFEWRHGEQEGKAGGQGGTVFVPANVSHNNRCAEAGGPCLNYAYFPKGFDVTKD